MKVKFYTDRPFGVRVRNWLKRQKGVKLVEKEPDLIISCYNPKIIPKEELTSPAINFHPGLLPYNRGMYPHIWPLVDGSPAGVTIHYISDKLDGGDIIAQAEVPVYPFDIASDLEERTQGYIFALFKLFWPKIKNGTIHSYSQKGKGSYHRASEIKKIQRFDKKVIDRLRACTFKDRSYAYFIDKGKKHYVGVKFFKEEDIKNFERRNHA